MRKQHRQRQHKKMVQSKKKRRRKKTKKKAKKEAETNTWLDNIVDLILTPKTERRGKGVNRLSRKDAEAYHLYLQSLAMKYYLDQLFLQFQVALLTIRFLSVKL